MLIAFTLPFRSHSMSKRHALACVLLGALVLPASASAQRRFELGLQDDSVLLRQEGMSRTHALSIAQSWGVTRLRVNVIFGEWKRDGWGPYDALVNAARARRLRVQLTLTGTPSYEPTLNGQLSWVRPDVALMRTFASVVASHFSGRVDRYSIWNEPNHPYFLASTSPRTYRRLYLAGRRGILKAQPHAKVLLGELCPCGDAQGWLAKVGRVPTAGVSVHPYQAAPPDQADDSPLGIHRTRQLVRWARRLERAPLYESEFGYSAGDPAQWTHVLAAIHWARAHGARQLVLYQLLRRTTASGIRGYGLSATPRLSATPGWNTGLVG